MKKFKFNPKAPRTEYDFYTRFIKEQLSTMNVGDKRILDMGGKTVVECRVMIWKIYPKRSGVSFRTKYDKENNDLWVGRVR